jgi:hypothetical protein
MAWRASGITWIERRSREFVYLARLHLPCLFLLPAPGFPPFPPHRRPSYSFLDRVALLLSRRFFPTVAALLCHRSFAPTPSRRPTPNPTQGKKHREGGRGLAGPRCLRRWSGGPRPRSQPPAEVWARAVGLGVPEPLPPRIVPGAARPTGRGGEGGQGGEPVGWGWGAARSRESLGEDAGTQRTPCSPVFEFPGLKRSTTSWRALGCRVPGRRAHACVSPLESPDPRLSVDENLRTRRS